MLTIAGVLIGAARVPERFFPGSFDYVFNSHNIMHVMTVGGSWSMHKAVTMDFEWFGHDDKCGPDAMRHWYWRWHETPIFD